MSNAESRGTCGHCHSEPAEVRFTWPVTATPHSQTAKLCGVCAAMFWTRWQHTPAGEGLQIEELM